MAERDATAATREQPNRTNADVPWPGKKEIRAACKTRTEIMSRANAPGVEGLIKKKLEWRLFSVILVLSV